MDVNVIMFPRKEKRSDQAKAFKKYYQISYHNKDAVDNLINYIARGAKLVPNNERVIGSIGGIGYDTQEIIKSFHRTKEIFYETDRQQVKHMVVSFRGRQMFSRKKIKKIFLKIIRPISDDYQVFYGLHYKDEYENNFHFHVAINTVSCQGMRFDWSKKDLESFKKRANRIWEKEVAHALFE